MIVLPTRNPLVRTVRIREHPTTEVWRSANLGFEMASLLQATICLRIPQNSNKLLLFA